MAKKLARFTVTPNDEGFRLHIEDDGGEVLELEATRDQIEVVADALDELLQASETEEGEV